VRFSGWTRCEGRMGGRALGTADEAEKANLALGFVTCLER
jgi:hypothetical protein